MYWHDRDECSGWEEGAPEASSTLTRIRDECERGLEPVGCEPVLMLSPDSAISLIRDAPAEDRKEWKEHDFTREV